MTEKKYKEKNKPIAVKESVHKDIAQFCLDYKYKHYKAVAEGFYLLRDKKEKEKKDLCYDK